MITPAYSATATERVLPRLALDFTTAVLDPRVTVARALNTATRFNSNGNIEIVNANLPRFDYDSINLSSKGLLIEETRENTLLYSADFSNAGYWGYANLTVTSNVAIAPDGLASADELIDDAVAGSHFVSSAATTTPASGSLTLSVFLKQNTLNWAAVSFQGFYAFFNLGSGVIGDVSADTTAKIEPCKNGWYRCSITATSSSATTYAVVRLSTGNGVFGYAGTGKSLYAWGAQCEAGAFATSYIPTAASTVTRNADVVSMTGTNFSDWYSNTRGAFWAAFDVLQSTAPAYIYSAYSGATGFSDSFIQYVFANTVDSFVYSGGVSQARLLAGVISANTPAKSARSYANANFAIATNGGSLATQLSGSLPVGVDRLQIGASPNTGDFLNGHIAKLFWYANMTNAELVAFTK